MIIKLNGKKCLKGNIFIKLSFDKVFWFLFWVGGKGKFLNLKMGEDMKK